MRDLKEQSTRNARPQLDSESETRHSGTLAVSQGISVPPLSQRQRSSARAELEAGFFRALAATARAFAAVGSSGVVLYWSAGAKDLFGYSAEDIIGQNLSLTLAELDQGLAAQREALAAGKATTFAANVQHRSGAMLPLQVRATPALNDSGEALATLLDFQDATPHESQPNLVTPPHEDELSADTVHDLNNVLATVQIYAGFVASSKLTPQQTGDLEIALAAARQGALLISSAMHRTSWPHAGKAAPNTGLIDVKEVVNRASEKLRRAVGAGVELAIQLPLTPLPVRAATEELEHVLLSLALNARDAMLGTGTLSITVRNTAVSEAHPLASEVPLGAHAVISVRDTGVGMSSEMQARIFEPFFTSKPRGQGSGLGLVVSLATIKRLGGALRVESELGRGAEFQVFLPLALEAAEAKPALLAAAQPARPVTVLLVEDDANMRDGLRRVLEAEGYQVLEAGDGTEAGEVAARHPDPIQLLLSDLTLPRSDGREALLRVRASRPDICAVFISGRLDRGRLPSDVDFVQKPFATPELLQALERALANAPPGAGRLVTTSPVVLIVDDDDDLRNAFARVIEECEFLSVPVKSGLHALQILEQRHVDIVICDQFMPGMDGVQLLELVRQRYPRCVRILFTAHPSSDVVLDAVNRGGVHKVLVKSMHAVAIRDEIERAVLASHRFSPTPT
jgi:PAS domain S-box-containing protein